MCSYKSQVCLYNSHFCGNHGFPFRIHRCLNKKKKEMNIIEVLSWHLSASFTFTNEPKCSHCLGSQAYTCSRKSQVCLSIRIYVTSLLAEVSHDEGSKKGWDTPRLVSFRGLIQNFWRASPPLSYGSPPRGTVDVDVDVFPVCLCPKSHVFFVAQTSENRTEYVCVCWPHNHLFHSVLPCNLTGIRKGTSCPYIQENTFHC